MRYLHCLAIDEAAIPSNEFGDLCRLKPEARKPTGFRAEIVSTDPTGDSVIRYALQLAQRHGLTRQYHSSATSYGSHIARWYEQSDLAAAELLLLNRQKLVQSLNDPDRDEEGRLILLASNAKRSVSVGRVFPNNIIVAGRVRQILENGQLLGVCFGEVVLKGKSAQASPEPFWELQASLVLPKMANTNRLTYYGWRGTPPKPFDGDYSRSVFIDDPPFDKGEVHYRRSDLKSLLRFDIARTYEKYLETHQALVICQRFYQYCLEAGIKLEADPVRVDPD